MAQENTFEQGESSLPINTSLAHQTFLRNNEDEKNHFDDVCQSYRQYAAFSMSQWANHQYRLHVLKESQRAILPNALKRDTLEFKARADQYKEATIRNQFCLDCILRHTGAPHSQQVVSMSKTVDDSQISKVSSVLKSLARDWSSDGAAEREMAYKPIISQMKRYLPLAKDKESRPVVCIPGAGVGRLAFEVSKLGYAVQGNEFSLFMLLASDFILNGSIATPDRPLEISPWLMESRNTHSLTDRCRSVQIPDIDPMSILTGNDDGTITPNFSMAAGDFFSIYDNPKEISQWDCVCSCFFLDACPNIVECIQLIYKMLKPGGFLINFGPLLYHWSGPGMRPDDRSVDEYQARYSHLDERYMRSVDITYEDVREILVNVGFEIVEEKVGVKALYTSDRRSMQTTVYRCVNFVAKKIAE